MSKIDKLLDDEKDKLNKLEIPDDIESKLRDTLNNIPDKKKKSLRGRVAAILIIVLLMSYNIDTLAYYGKKLIGYENVMSGTLQELNELGKGQSIGKSYTFKDGVEVLLDGVMLDDNNMVIFYTIKDPFNDAQEKGINVYVKGMFGRGFSNGGSGTASEDGSTMNWVISTNEAPMFFERTITLELDYRHDQGDYEHGEISFKLDRSQAVGNSLKMNINKKIKLGNRSINVKTLVASPTSSVVRGEIQNILELGLDYITDNRLRPEDIEMVLTADGKKISNLGSGMSTDNKGSTFYITFDALPVDTKEIDLRLVAFSGDYDVNEVYKINREYTTNIKVLEQDVKINNIYEEEGSTYINFTTEESTVLSRVYLNIDGERKELQETIPGEFEKVVEEDAAKIYFTRTMRFKGTGDNLELDIQRIRYNKEYDKTIYEYKLD